SSGGRAIFFTVCNSAREKRVRPGNRAALLQAALLQAHRVVCLPAGILAGVSGASGRSAGTGGASGAVARPGERLSDPRGGNRIRIAERGYTGGSRQSVPVVRGSSTFQSVRGKQWLNIYSLPAAWFLHWAKGSPPHPSGACWR